MTYSDGLARKALQNGFHGMILSPERDEVAYAAVKGAIDEAYASGTEVNKHSRRPYLYAIGVLLALSLLIFASVYATQHFPALAESSNKSVFTDGAPSWELVVIGETQAEAQGDPVVIDARAKMGAEWGYGGSVQYKDYLYLRTVNLVDNTQVRVLVYHWTLIGGWEYFDQQDI